MIEKKYYSIFNAFIDYFYYAIDVILKKLYCTYIIYDEFYKILLKKTGIFLK